MKVLVRRQSPGISPNPIPQTSPYHRSTCPKDTVVPRMGSSKVSTHLRGTAPRGTVSTRMSSCPNLRYRNSPVLARSHPQGLAKNSRQVFAYLHLGTNRRWKKASLSASRALRSRSTSLRQRQRRPRQVWRTPSKKSINRCHSRSRWR